MFYNKASNMQRQNKKGINPQTKQKLGKNKWENDIKHHVKLHLNSRIYSSGYKNDFLMFG